MNSKYVLLVVGLLGVAAAVYGIIKGQSFTDNIIPIICGASLVWGYFELKKKEEKSS